MEWGKVTKSGEDLFFFPPFHFSKWLKFVLGQPKWEFSTGKKYFTLGKKSGKITLPPQKNILVTPLPILEHFWCISTCPILVYLYGLNQACNTSIILRDSIRMGIWFSIVQYIHSSIWEFKYTFPIPDIRFWKNASLCKWLNMSLIAYTGPHTGIKFICLRISSIHHLWMCSSILFIFSTCENVMRKNESECLRCECKYESRNTLTIQVSLWNYKILWILISQRVPLRY